MKVLSSEEVHVDFLTPVICHSSSSPTEVNGLMTNGCRFQVSEYIETVLEVANLILAEFCEASLCEPMELDAGRPVSFVSPLKFDASWSFSGIRLCLEVVYLFGAASLWYRLEP